VSNHQTISSGRRPGFETPVERHRNKDGKSLQCGPGEIRGRIVSGRLCGAKLRTLDGAPGDKGDQNSGSGPSPREACGGSSLSMSHNCDGTSELTQADLPFHLTGSQAKTAFALRKNAELMIREAGLSACGFLTLTVGEMEGETFRQVWDATEASRRIHHLQRRVLSALFERAIIVTERHKNGAIHFHVIGVLRGR